MKEKSIEEQLVAILGSLQNMVSIFQNGKEINLDGPAKVKGAAWVNKGVCSGSFGYHEKVDRYADEHELMCVIREAYAANGLEITLDTEDGVDLFYKVFTEAVRYFCSRNIGVRLADRLAFKPKLYAADKDGGDGTAPRAYIQPYMCNADFSRMECEVELNHSPSFLNRKRREAVRERACREKWARREGAEKVREAIAGRKTHIECPNCGYSICISNTQEPAHSSPHGIVEDCE